MNVKVKLWKSAWLLLTLFSACQALQAQSPDLVCAEAARTLVDGTRSMLDNSSASRSATHNEIRWSTHEGHKGVCRVDSEGRVYEIAITEFPPRAGYEYSLTCSSVRYRRKECQLKEPGSVRLDRQLSKAQCVQNRTWGSDNRVLWVDQGCSGQFTVTTRPAWEPYSLTCESIRNGRTECRMKGAADVSISRQLSSTSCRLNTNWGVSNDVLWVDRGCRAVFRVSPVNSDGYPGNVRTAAIRACDNRARSRGYDVLNARVLEAEKNHVDVELLGERKQIRVDLFCRYDTATRQANLYGS